LGYEDDPATVTSTQTRWPKLGLGGQVFLLVLGVCVGVWGVFAAEVQYQLWFFALGAGCLLVLIGIPLVLLYRNFKEPTEKVLIEIAVDVAKAKWKDKRRRP